MTTSSDKNQKPTKKKKTKGPIRFEAVIPIAVILGLIVGYFVVFFDSHFRWAIQTFATKANGAEVNVGSLTTSFIRGSLQISDIQITNPENPSTNRLVIGLIHWKLNWDGLLRAKVVIDNASILNIQVNVPRKKPGFVLPPPPPPSGPSQLEVAKKEILENAQKAFNKNVFGDISSILAGNDPTRQLKNIEGTLKASGKLEEIKKNLAEKEAAWKDRLARLPQGKDIDALVARGKAVKTSGFSDPGEVQKSVQEIESIIRELDAKYKAVQETQASVGSDYGQIQNYFKEVDQAIKADIKDLENRLKIPKLDVESITKVLFGPAFLSKVKQFEKYTTMARQYMPAKKSSTEKPEKKILPEERLKGRTYKFGRARAYPLFWLRKAEISSKSSEGSFSSDMTGLLTDVTDDPSLIGRPTVLSFEGSFPNQKIFGVSGKLSLDHTGERAVESLLAKVESFPISARSLADSEDLKMAIDEAKGYSSLVGILKDEELSLQIKTVMKESKISVVAKNDIVRDVLSSVVKGLPNIEVNAQAKGRWDSLAFGLDSNLGNEISKGFEKQLQAKINEARKKIESLVNDKVAAEKARLEGEANKYKKQADTAIKAKTDELNKTKAQLEEQKNKAVNETKNRLQQEGAKALDDIKKGLGF